MLRNEATQAAFGAALLAWFDRCGRKNLPWQHPATPYRVWVSEVMLQQTQVRTVIPYFTRFTARYPDVASLADTSQEQVLHLWSGLGYYARGRNLHRAAQLMRDRHGGVVPDSLEALVALPGIGRSTAGAILSLGFNQRAAVLDANIRRVLARCLQTADTGSRELWNIAARLSPRERPADHTQALMDLGATVCTPRTPRCQDCPVRTFCQSFQHAAIASQPRRKRTGPRPERHTTALVVVAKPGILLERRPPRGVWGGLWSLPEIDNPQTAGNWLRDNIGCQDPPQPRPLPEICHDFSHFRLLMRPLAFVVRDPPVQIAERPFLWYKEGMDAGLPAPVKKLVERLPPGDFP